MDGPNAPMEWEKIAYAVGAFLVGLLSGILKTIAPGYMELYQENRELREKVRGLEDEMRDQEESFEKEMETKDHEMAKKEKQIEALERRNFKR
jgi:septin family protein